MKVLFVTNAASMIELFNMNNIRMLLDMGAEVSVATNFNEGNTCSPERIRKLKETLDVWGVPYYQVDFGRSPMAIRKNRAAYRQLLELARKEQFSFIHCHTPMGAALARPVAHSTGTKVMYTAHGFHFFKGAPLKYWMLYYPVEKILAHYTDILITMNHEDYARAKAKFRHCEVDYIHGIGINFAKFERVDSAEAQEKKAELRKSLGLAEDDKFLLSVGELIPRKNQESVIRAMAKITDPKTHLFICGIGPLRESLEELTRQLHVDSRVHFLGFRDDISDLCHACDLYVFASLQEGLPVAVLEAVVSRTPIVCSDIRGNEDLVLQKECRFAPKDVDGIAQAITHGLQMDFSKATKENYENAKPYAVEHVMAETKALYQKILGMAEE